jgi:ubiquinone biosynthesis protein COQ4
MATTSHLGRQPKRLERSWSAVLRTTPRILTYARNPFALSSARSMTEFVLSIGGPRIQREFDEFASTEVGRRLLEERPDLASVLDDHEALRALPEGSLGRAYLALIQGESMGDCGAEDTMSEANFFVDILRVEEIGGTLKWPPEIIWFMRRLTMTHDLTHVFTGYGTDNAGEFANIAYTIGHFRLHVLTPVLAGLALAAPKVGRRRWVKYVLAAYRRGRHQRRKLAHLDYETMLRLHLEDVRREVGLQPFEEAHPDGRIEDDLGFPNINKQVLLST